MTNLGPYLCEADNKVNRVLNIIQKHVKTYSNPHIDNKPKIIQDKRDASMITVKLPEYNIAGSFHRPNTTNKSERETKEINNKLLKKIEGDLKKLSSDIEDLSVNANSLFVKVKT